jgi:hypothetical protein
MRNFSDVQMRLERITLSVGTAENGLDVEGNLSTALQPRGE